MIWMSFVLLRLEYRWLAQLRALPHPMDCRKRAATGQHFRELFLNLLFQGFCVSWTSNGMDADTALSAGLDNKEFLFDNKKVVRPRTPYGNLRMT